MINIRIAWIHSLQDCTLEHEKKTINFQQKRNKFKIYLEIKLMKQEFDYININLLSKEKLYWIENISLRDNWSLKILNVIWKIK